MKGLSSEAAKAIENMISGKFNAISLDFLGLVPKILKQKRIKFTTNKNSLTSLFLSALDSKQPNKDEEDVLKVLLRVASNYTDALRDRTTARVINSIDSYVKDKNVKKQPIKSNKITAIVEKEMKSAKNHFKMIANSESNKASNTGTALQISKLADQKGEEDPTVFFIVTVDDVTGPEEFVLHLLPDGKTPRLWKLSEISSDYHKKGGPTPAISGLHPNCRCKLTYLASGFGFSASGNVKYIAPDHDEFKAQRDQYGLPRNKSMKKSEEDVSVFTPQEHPNNSTEPNEGKHQVSHQTNSGRVVWTPKSLRWGGKNVNSDQMDFLHRTAWKTFAQKNKVQKGSPYSNTLINLNKDIINDNDKHLRLSKTIVTA